jgi:hypothetical protein
MGMGMRMVRRGDEEEEKRQKGVVVASLAKPPPSFFPHLPNEAGRVGGWLLLFFLMGPWFALFVEFFFRGPSLGCGISGYV